MVPRISLEIVSCGGLRRPAVIGRTLESMDVVIGSGTYVDAVWCTVTMNGSDKSY